MPLSLQAAGKTDVGCVRSNNEDNLGLDLQTGIFVVCDGMGGQVAGEVASRIGVDSVLDYFRRGSSNGGPAAAQPAPSADAESPLAQAVHFANARIHETAVHNPGLGGMGSTIVAALVRDDAASIAHVGDSRAYLLRDGEIRQLTADHSLVMEQVRRGLITREQANRSEMQNIITRALGSDDAVQVDVQDVALQPGDMLLLTSDGLTRHLGDERIREIVRTASDLQRACDALIAAARNEGGEDNITCLLVKTA
jgi:serine/threonine protein phosphatase PrpC